MSQSRVWPSWEGMFLHMSTTKTCNSRLKENVFKEVHCETFDQTIQITMENNERDVSDDEQIVGEDEVDQDNKDEEPGENSEEEDDDEPEEEEDEEENMWVGIRDEVEEQQKEKLEFQKSGNSQGVAVVKAYDSLLPLYRQEVRDVLEDLKWMHALERTASIKKQWQPETNSWTKRDMTGYVIESTELATQQRQFLLNRLFQEQTVPGD